jgi:spermidine synthase
VLVLYRRDHEFLLDDVLARLREHAVSYDFVLASQPWRARMGVAFKVEKILAPLARSLAPGGRLLTVQSWGRDPAAEIVERLWPGEMPFTVDRHVLLAALRTELGEDAADYDLADPPDEDAVFRYEMHTLPSEIGDRIGTSTLFAAWNAVIYVNQIEDERLRETLLEGEYLQVTQDVLREHGALWFNDEAFVVARRRGG